MPTTKKYKSHNAAAETLRRFFAGNPAPDRVSVRQIFKNTGREQKLFKDNMAWLSNKLTTLRYYNLINAEYSYEGRRRLESISLTLDGKRVMGLAQARYETPAYSETAADKGAPEGQKASINDVLELVNKLKIMYPELDIALTIKSKQAG